MHELPFKTLIAEESVVGIDEEAKAASDEADMIIQKKLEQKKKQKEELQVQFDEEEDRERKRLEEEQKKQQDIASTVFVSEILVMGGLFVVGRRHSFTNTCIGTHACTCTRRHPHLH